MKISEFIKTASLRQKLFDPEYAQRHSRVMAKRRSRQMMRPLRDFERRKEMARRQGFPSTKKLFKSEDVTMPDNRSFFVEDLEDIIVGEAWFAPRGSTADKIAARSGTGSQQPSGPLPGSPAHRAARAAAFEKQKQRWAQQKAAKAAALPPDVAARKQARMATTEAMSKSIDSELPPNVKKQRRPIFRPGEDKHSRLMQGQYPHSGAGSAQRSPLN